MKSAFELQTIGNSILDHLNKLGCNPMESYAIISMVRNRIDNNVDQSIVKQMLKKGTKRV